MAARYSGTAIPPRLLIVAEDPRLRSDLHAFSLKYLPGSSVVQRRDLRDNQTVWDLRSQSYALVLVECLAENRDELEFLASLNASGLANTAIVVVTPASHIAAIHSMNMGASAFIDRGDLHDDSFRNAVFRALKAAGVAVERELPQAGTLLPPELGIKGYQPIRTLSVTTESCVLLVRHSESNRQFVLKFLPDPSNERVVKRFLQECRIANTQRHENLVRVHEQGLSSNAAYYVMEYLAGGSLQAALENQFSIERTLRTLRQVALSLQSLHEDNITHLDVKSANVLFRDENTAVLIDFGAARHRLINRNYTLKDHALGTPHYMSPEQATGRPLDQRSDLYALGVVFFEMLTGACPYQGDTIQEVLICHLRNPIPQLSLHQQAFQPIINRLLAKKIEDRYDSVDDLLRALDEATSNASARSIKSVTELPPLVPEPPTQ